MGQNKIKRDRRLARQTNEKCNKFILVGMFRDEEHIIHQMINSLVHLIDAYLLVDTGSVDRSVEIVENMMKEKNIPGRVAFQEWLDDYGANRTINQELAEEWIEENSQPNEQWYILLMDADDRLVDPRYSVDEASQTEVLEHLASIDKKSLHGEYIQLMCRFSTIEMRRPIAVKYDPEKRWKWYCPRHEYLALRERGDNFHCQWIDDFYLLARSAGARSKDPTRTIGDILAIEKWLRNNRGDTDEPRMTFYLAQTFYDGQMYEQSEEVYLRAAEICISYEERYMALHEAASCRILSNNDDYKVEEYLRRAISIDPNRLEARFALAKRINDRLYHNDAWGIVASFAGNHVPSSNYSIKVYTDMYQWRFDDLCAFILYNAIDCGSVKWRMKKSKKLWSDVLEKKEEYNISKDDVERIENGIRYCDSNLNKDNEKEKAEDG